MTDVQSGLVPLLDEQTGRFPDEFAPPSVAADAVAARDAAAAAAAAQQAAEAAENSAAEHEREAGQIVEDATATIPGLISEQVTAQVDPKVATATQAKDDAETARGAAQTARDDALQALSATEVEQITLTGNLAYTLPTGVANRVHSVVFTQDAPGGHTVTYDGQPVTVDLTAGASTTVELHPVGAGHAIRYPVTNLDAQVSALAEDGGSALGASLSSTYAPLSVASGAGLEDEAVSLRHMAKPLTSAYNQFDVLDQVGANIVDGYYVNSGGGLVAGAAYFVSSKFYLKPSTQYTISPVWGPAGYRGAFYSASGAYLSMVPGETFTTPANAKYVRFTVYKATYKGFTWTSAMLVLGPTLPATFTPYGIKVPWLIPSDNTVSSDAIQVGAVGSTELAAGAVIPIHLSDIGAHNFFDIRIEADAIQNTIVNSDGTTSVYSGYKVVGPVRVRAGVQYSMNCSFNANTWGVSRVYRVNAFTALGVPIAGSNIEVWDDELTSATFTTAPNAAYLLLTVKSTPPNGLTRLMLVEGDTLPTTFVPYGVAVGWLRPAIDYLPNRWAGKTALFIGDSITRGYSPGVDHTDPPVVEGGQITPTFTTLVGQYLGLTAKNYGYDGATMADTASGFVHWATEWATKLAAEDTADYIGILLGANDGQGAIGTTADTTNATYCGATKNLVAGLLAKYPTAQVFVMTPTYPYPLLAQAVRDVCAYMKVPCLDLHREDGMRATYSGNSTVIPEVLAAMVGTGHPNQAGHRRLASLIAGFISTH